MRRILPLPKVSSKTLSGLILFAPVYNGVTFLKYVPSKMAHLDANPTVLCAISEHQVYAMTLPYEKRSKNMACLQMINVLIALKPWYVQWTGPSVISNVTTKLWFPCSLA